MMGDELSINGRPVQGLALPETVLRKMFRTNAERVYFAKNRAL